MQEMRSHNWYKRRQIVLLRGLLIIAVGALLVDAGVKNAGLAALILIVAFALSNVLLCFLPMRLVHAVRFELIVGALDLAVVALGIQMAGVAAGALPVSCLLMVLVVALGNYKAHTIAGGMAVGALHAWLILSSGGGAEIGRQLALQIIFLYSVGLYYGSMTEGIHKVRRRQEAESLERRELSALLEILGTATSSLDLRQVTKTIVDRLTTIVPAVRCSIIYINESMTKCFVMASHDNPEVDMLELDLQKYPEILHAIKTRTPTVIDDISSHPLMAEVQNYLKDLSFHSILVIPLLFCDDLLGTLCLRTAREDQTFSEREINFCTAVARASANALKNAFLHRQVLEESTRHRTTSQKLARILNHSPELIITTDNEGRITEFNRGAELALGYGKQEMLGRSYDLFLAADVGVDLMEKVFSAGALANHGTQLRKQDGSELAVDFHITVLKDELDEVAGTLWIGRDVTELRTAQMQLAQAEKLSTIGEVISGVAHELNNPLSGVLGYSQLLMARHSQSPFVRELEKINDSALRCQKIVRNLLSFARASKPERKRLGINGIIEKALDIKRYNLHVNNVEVVKELDPELPCTMLDFHQIQQIFLNLVNNAQHAMAATRERPSRLTIRTSFADGKVRAELSDNGEGMSKETLGRIFDPFFTTKEQGEGTGLGLSISYGIIKEHHGSISAHSRKGEGSTFVVEIPVLQAEEEQDGDAGYEAGSVITEPRIGRHILVVDDETMIQDLLMDTLEDLGHKVDTAANGDEACRKISAAGYDLVITDVRMPRMDGMSLYRNILSMRPELKGKIIFITGDLIDTDTTRFLAETEARTIPKPLDIRRIARAVQQTFESDSKERLPAI
jgi:PAS domain S-box-containing protein